jgi:hypothetical protein
VAQRGREEAEAAGRKPPPAAKKPSKPLFAKKGPEADAAAAAAAAEERGTADGEAAAARNCKYVFDAGGFEAVTAAVRQFRTGGRRGSIGCSCSKCSADADPAGIRAQQARLWSAGVLGAMDRLAVAHCAAVARAAEAELGM